MTVSSVLTWDSVSELTSVVSAWAAAGAERLASMWDVMTEMHNFLEEWKDANGDMGGTEFTQPELRRLDWFFKALKKKTPWEEISEAEMKEFSWYRAFSGFSYYDAVSYTHLTLPTNREV